MSFIVYFFVALIAAGSVLFGLDWLQAPLSPMPASKYELRAAMPPPPAPTVAKVEPKVEPTPAAAPVIAAKPQAPVAAAPVVPATPAVPEPQPVPIIAAEPSEPAATQAAAPACNIEVCAAAYRSFTAADCTYQPNEGPRRLCTRGASPAAAATSAPTPPTEARAQACNIDACAAAYRSFTAADCTFQPADGPRRACTK
jgi:hypothetical protein